MVQPGPLLKSIYIKIRVHNYQSSVCGFFVLFIVAVNYYGQGKCVIVISKSNNLYLLLLLLSYTKSTLKTVDIIS